MATTRRVVTEVTDGGRAGLESRVVGLERDVSAIRTDISSLSDTFGREVNRLAESIRQSGEDRASQLAALDKKVSVSQTTNWGTIWSAVGVSVLIVTTILALFVAPLHVEIVKNKEISTTGNDKDTEIARLHREIGDGSDRNLANEIQWLKDAENQRSEYQERINGLMWTKCYGESFPVMQFQDHGPSRDGK